jgi:hypothetical protein
MDKEKKRKIEFSYYGLYLQMHLKDIGAPRQDDVDFIDARADAAADEFDSVRRSGATVDQSQESAMHVLLEGLDIDEDEWQAAFAETGKEGEP